MLKRTFPLLLLLLTTWSLAAQINYAPDITAWKKTPYQTPRPNDGINGGPALEYVRTDRQSYQFDHVPCPKVIPGKRYRAGVYVRTEGMPRQKGGATFAVEVSRHSGVEYGVWPKGTTDAKDWTKVEGTITVPSDAKSVVMLLYMREGATGKAWFARPYIYEDVPVLHGDIIFPAGKYAIPAGKSDLVFSVNAEGIDLTGKTFGIEIRKEGKTVLSLRKKTEKNRIILKDITLTPGKYAAVLRPDIPGMKELHPEFTVLPPDSKPEKGNYSRVDRYGRLILNGKPFMPIGLYASGQNTRKDFRFWKEAGFNCAMPYHLLRWQRKGTSGKLSQIREAMQECAEEGILLLFSLKDVRPGKWEEFDGIRGNQRVAEHLVTRLKEHPAVLGWYLNDEEADDLHYKGLRKQVSSLDPYHVTVQVQNTLSRLPMTVGYSDIFAPDPYPFYKESDGMDSAADHMLDARRHFGPALMAVPQTFAWYQYRKYMKGTWYPSLKQMRSHILLEAILGAKGFFFYTYSAPGFHRKNTGEDKWPEIRQLTGMLQELSPFILSLETAPEVRLSGVKGRVFAKAMKAEEKVKVLVAGTKGKTEAKLTVPGQEKLRSRWGRTQNLGNGVYLFRGNGADADILELEK